MLDPSVLLAADLGQPGVYVAGVDAIARRVIATGRRTGGRGDPGAVTEVLGPRTAQVLKPTRTRRGTTPSSTAPPTCPPRFVPAFLEAEYSTVVLPNLVTTRDDYLKVRRPGRGVALNRTRRLAVWDIIASYRAAARQPAPRTSTRRPRSPRAAH